MTQKLSGCQFQGILKRAPATSGNWIAQPLIVGFVFLLLYHFVVFSISKVWGKRAEPKKAKQLEEKTQTQRQKPSPGENIVHEDFHLTGSIEKEATGLPTCVTTLKSHKQENYTGALHPFHVLCNVSFLYYLVFSYLSHLIMIMIHHVVFLAYFALHWISDCRMYYLILSNSIIYCLFFAVSGLYCILFFCLRFAYAVAGSAYAGRLCLEVPTHAHAYHSIFWGVCVLSCLFMFCLCGSWSGWSLRTVLNCRDDWPKGLKGPKSCRCLREAYTKPTGRMGYKCWCSFALSVCFVTIGCWACACYRAAWMI